MRSNRKFFEGSGKVTGDRYEVTELGDDLTKIVMIVEKAKYRSFTYISTKKIETKSPKGSSIYERLMRNKIESAKNFLKLRYMSDVGIEERKSKK